MQMHLRLEPPVSFPWPVLRSPAAVGASVVVGGGDVVLLLAVGGGGVATLVRLGWWWWCDVAACGRGRSFCK
jgi:hypothetical protein